jgi:hypothetical protein
VTRQKVTVRMCKTSLNPSVLNPARLNTFSVCLGGGTRSCPRWFTAILVPLDQQVVVAGLRITMSGGSHLFGMRFRLLVAKAQGQRCGVALWNKCWVSVFIRSRVTIGNRTYSRSMLCLEQLAAYARCPEWPNTNATFSLRTPSAAVHSVVSLRLPKDCLYNFSAFRQGDGCRSYRECR